MFGKSKATIDPPTSEKKTESYEKALADCTEYFTAHNTSQTKLSFDTKLIITSAAIRANFSDLIFCGYYIVRNQLDGESKPTDKKMLELGAYQSHILATPWIDFGKGVCGQCWEEKTTQVVDDVKECKNYIACDGLTQSEIVLPVFKGKEDQSEVVAVLDIDSGIKKRFDKVDIEYLQKFVDLLYQ